MTQYRKHKGTFHDDASFEQSSEGRARYCGSVFDLQGKCGISCGIPNNNDNPKAQKQDAGYKRQQQVRLRSQDNYDNRDQQYINGSSAESVGNIGLN